jgi:hypothetical protein
MTRQRVVASVRRIAIWWSHFERIMLAFEDLGCEELLA